MNGRGWCHFLHPGFKHIKYALIFTFPVTLTTPLCYCFRQFIRNAVITVKKKVFHLFFLLMLLFLILLRKDQKIFKTPSNCQTLVTSVHAKLFIRHLHQLNLVNLQPYYQFGLFHTLLAHADGECSANSVRHN